MGSVYRDRDRFDDSRTTISSARRGDGGYTTVKRYVVKDDDSRSSYGGRDRDRRESERPVERVEETRIIRREVDVEEPPRRPEPRYDLGERELVIRRDRSEGPPRRDYGFDRRRDEVETDRELVIRRTTDREGPRGDDRELTITRYDERRDVREDYLSPQRGSFDDRDRDLQKYTRTSEYYSPPPQPQVIVIKQEPIIIRERVRDDDLQIIKRSDVDDERSVVRRDDRSRDGRGGREEEYFYEKKVRERVDEPRRDDREDDFYERKSMRREVSPGDSVSQVGGRERDRGRQQSRGRDDYSSDDSMVYVRKEVRETSEDGSPHHRRHLAEGVVAGIGAAELLRNHKKKEGRETGGGLSRVGKDIGAGVVGAIAAEGISRARSRYRSQSRRRDRSESRETRRDKKGGGKSRKGSSSSEHSSRERLKTLGKYGLGAAALAAAVAYAKNRSDKNKEADAGGDRRSRSRQRRGSGSVDDSNADDARNPTHRNKRIAEAGAAGAVVAGLIERARSKSRKGEGRERSQSRVRQALPILAAGLGSAALAGVYEKNKAGKQFEEAEKDRRRDRSRHKTRSAARDSGMNPDGSQNVGYNDPNLIEYGQGSIYGNNYGADYHGRPQQQDAYYNNENTAVVPAAAGGGYGAQREIRSRSNSRRRDSSRSSSSDAGRQQRRRHRRNDEGLAAGGVGAAAAATEYERKKAEKRERKARRRQEQQQQQGDYGAYDGTYQPPQPYTPPPPQVNDPYASQSGFYPQPNQFAPPPVQQGYQAPHMPATAAGAFAPGTGYDPSSFPPPPTGPVPTQGAPAYNDHYVSGGNQNPYASRGQGGDENVSAASPPTAFGIPFQSPVNTHMNYDRHYSVPDAGLNNVSRAPFPPAITLQRPSVSGSSSSKQYQPPVQEIYTPPSDRSPRSSSVPPPSTATSPRKSVQFADGPFVAPQHGPPDPTSSPEQPNHSHRSHRDGLARGYEAGDDTDSTPDELRRRTEPNISAPRGMPETTDTKRRHHRHTRRRSHEPQSSNAASGLVSDSKRRHRDGAITPSSDETVDLPPRFDGNGQKKREPGEDPLADTFDGLLKGKVFGNFMDGLFGPGGRIGKGSGSGAK